MSGRRWGDQLAQSYAFEPRILFILFYSDGFKIVICNSECQVPIRHAAFSCDYSCFYFCRTTAMCTHVRRRQDHVRHCQMQSKKAKQLNVESRIKDVMYVFSVY